MRDEKAGAGLSAGRHLVHNSCRRIGGMEMATQRNTRSDGSAFDSETIEAVWKKATPVPGQTIFRKDRCGAPIMRSRYGKTEKWGWEIDHIKPVSAGGTDDESNLQALQWENNRAKGDSKGDWECAVRL
jgi:hypothetical protein